MEADRQSIVEIQHSLERFIEELTERGAPSGIAAHLRLALQRLDAYVAMMDRWESGSGWKREGPLT